MALHEIYTAQDLKDFRDLVNAGNLTESAILMNDIDLAGNDSDQWIPIASQASRQWPEYTGTFDGNGYKISGLYINRSTVLDEYGEPDYDIDDCAFIGQLVDEGIVKNLTLEGYILGGWWSVAGFVGELWGGKIINCINKVIITGPEDGDTLGGIAGCCGWGNTIPRNSEIANCTNDANVGIEIGSGAFGGIIGFGNGCSITNCINNGNVFGGSYAVAGISGDNNRSVIDNCVNTGNITGTFGTYDCEVAGIASYCDDESIISNCVNTGTITGLDYVAGITDRIRGDAQIKNCVNEGTIVCEGTYYGSICGELDIPITTTYGDDFSVSFTLNDGNIDMGTVYPNYKHYYEDVTPTGTIHEIYTAQDLIDFRDYVNAGHFTESAILMNDIDLNGSSSNQFWPTIAGYIIDSPYNGTYYNGTFDGNYHSISGIYIDDTLSHGYECVAFICLAGDQAIIKNLTLWGNVTLSGYLSAGFVSVGKGCNIINCVNNINITCSGSDIYVAGIVSSLFPPVSNKLPLILNCVNNGDINAPNGSGVSGIVCQVRQNNLNIINCVNTGRLTGYAYVAGIYAEDIGDYIIKSINIINCGNTGHIISNGTSWSPCAGIAISGHAYNCVNTGIIDGNEYLGGILCWGTAANCISTGLIRYHGTDNIGYGNIFAYVTNLNPSLNYNNYYLPIENPSDTIQGTNFGYVDSVTNTGVATVAGIIEIILRDGIDGPAIIPLATCHLYDDPGNTYYEILNSEYTNGATTVVMDNVSSNGDYPDNNFYLNTSCNRAGINKNTGNSIMTTIENAFETYTEGNAPNVASSIEDFRTNKKVITPKIYPDINTDITDITFSNWSVSDNTRARIENDTVVLLPPTVPKKEIIIDKL